MVLVLFDNEGSIHFQQFSLEFTSALLVVSIISIEVAGNIRTLLRKFLQIRCGILIYSSNIFLQVAKLKANLLGLIDLLGICCLNCFDDLQLLLSDPIDFVYQLG